MIKVEQVIFHESRETNTRSSLLYIDGVFQCFTIENLEKSIPVGTYELKERRDLTPLTQRYAAKYDWFCWFAEILVPKRTGIYLHLANWSKQLKGCIAPVTYIDYTSGFGGNSQKAWCGFYHYMAEQLEHESGVYIVSRIPKTCLS